MTDRALPYACAVSNRAATELIMHGEPKLAKQLATLNRAMCDFIHALHAEREASSTAQQIAYRARQLDALRILRDGTTP